MGCPTGSEISNLDYNLKRKELMDKIIKHIAQAPKDIAADIQLSQLVDLDNIQRGGAYGNDTLAYRANFYMDLEDKNTPQKK